jgi:hypothetical protein
VRLLKELAIVFEHTLLVTIVPDFGLRQTYFQNKQIKFSRLTPIIYHEGQSVGSLIAAETSRTWQYLDSQRYFAGGDSLEVCMMVHARDREMIADAIRTYPLLKYCFLDIEDVAAKIAPAGADLLARRRSAGASVCPGCNRESLCRQGADSVLGVSQGADRLVRTDSRNPRHRRGGHRVQPLPGCRHFCRNRKT